MKCGLPDSRLDVFAISVVAASTLILGSAASVEALGAKRRGSPP